MTTGAAVARIDLARLDRPRAWPQTRRMLCSWQARGFAIIEVGGVPIDLASIAAAESAASLPRPEGVAPSAIAILVVYDRGLAARIDWLLERLEANRPPPDQPPPVGS